MRIIRSLLSNLANFLLAFTLAVIIWVTAVRLNDPVGSQSFQVDVETVGKPADGQLENEPPTSVLITTQGPLSALSDLSPGDFRGVIDLTEVPFGESDVEIRIQGGHERVEILSKFPETALIQMAQIISRDIPVTVEVRGDVARGHRAEDEQFEPATIQVTGVASRVNQLSEARVTVSVDNAQENINLLRRPTFYDLQGNVASVVGLAVSPGEVEVIVPISELAGFAEKPITVNWVGEPAQGYRLLDVTVEPASVQVTGRPAELELLSRLETEAVDISGLTESLTLPVALDLPGGITLMDVQPVIVSFEIEPILTSDVVPEPVEVRGLGEDLEAILDPNEVLVFLFGPLPVLESLGEDDVRVTVDLLNLEPGTYILEPIVSLAANDIEFRSTQPAVITVLITPTITTTQGLTATDVLDEGSALLLPESDSQADCVPLPGGGCVAVGWPGVPAAMLAATAVAGVVRRRNWLKHHKSAALLHVEWADFHGVKNQSEESVNDC